MDLRVPLLQISLSADRRVCRNGLMRPALLFTLAFSTFSVAVSAQPDRTVEYKRVGDLALTLDIFEPQDHRPGDSRPAIVFFFGGGWVKGSKNHFYPQAEYLANRGMVAICADYRTESRHGTTPAACVRDGKSAIRWLREHAGELGIDPNRLAAGGGSAGGQVAVATATLDGYNEVTDNLQISCRPNALVLFNPVFDNGPTGYGYDRVQDYWRSFSPIHNLHANMPPTIVFLGTEDDLIPVETGRRFQEQMQALGVRSELLLYPEEKHGFFNHSKFNETLFEADRFLASLGYLAGPPAIDQHTPSE